MKKIEAADVKELVNSAARIALWLCDEIEPANNDVLERDLDDLYELAVAAERKARAEGRLGH